MPSSALKKGEKELMYNKYERFWASSHSMEMEPSGGMFLGNWVPLFPGGRGQDLRAVSCIYVYEPKAKSQFFKLQPVTSFILRWFPELTLKDSSGSLIVI